MFPRMLASTGPSVALVPLVQGLKKNMINDSGKHNFFLLQTTKCLDKVPIKVPKALLTVPVEGMLG